MSELKEETTIDIIEAEDPAETENPAGAEKTVEAEKNAETENSAETELSEAAEQEEKADPEGKEKPAEKSDKETVSETEDGGPDGTATADEEQESGSAEDVTEEAAAQESEGGSTEESAEAPAAPAFDADAYLEQLAEAKRSITAGIVIYKGRINEKLQERTPEGYNALTSIINEPQYDRISQYDAELAAFKTTGSIYQMEAGAEPVTIYDSIEYLDDYTVVYEQMMFFLRRMQFGLDYSDYMIWLQEWCLTVHFVVQMLQESELGEKGKVALILADLYEENGQKKEAVYLLNMMKEQCSEEEQALIAEKLEKLQES
ncbi:MAG: hypothetical protein IKH46_15455 [Lachnospiraceae bacterium]|nr:hypothetical protein [Lachnospiraceae bacterium]